MKIILIVEDTQKNLNAAKAFFSTITDFEFVHATNRKDAEALLPTVDALITDRHMPYEDKDTMADYPFVEREGELKNVFQTHGYILLAKSAELEIPAIMISEHGNLMIMRIEDAEKAKKIARDISDLSPYSFESDDRGFDMNQNYIVEEYELSKTDLRAWEMGWNELRKQF